MSEGLARRDVLEQVDACPGLVGQDLRQSRGEVHQAFASVRAVIQQLGLRLDATTRWPMGLIRSPVAIATLDWMALVAADAGVADTRGESRQGMGSDDRAGELVAIPAGS